MTNNQHKVISYIQLAVADKEFIKEEEILALVESFSLITPLTAPEKKQVIEELHARLSVRMDRGACVKAQEHVSWYYAAKKDLPSKYWDRYRLYLLQNMGFGGEVIDALDSSTDEMMDMLGNTTNESAFYRRGLVIGDVQSGKTATYTALINKAADAGYKVIILLTGTIEKLRRQTQSRLDEGFIGLDSTALSKNNPNQFVGVGKIDSSVAGWAVTSTVSDFNTSTANKLTGQLAGISDPVLFVLKKNTSVLKKLEQWLRVYNANPADRKIHIPMLLIDDEADNASVNTKKPENDPTVINSNIRKLLELFVRSNYVGFTATPFANIFINPDSNDEMLADDLFPTDFIYALEAPSNYVGARGIFSENGQYHYMLRNNDDCEFYLPEKHNRFARLSDLPPSLKEAIASFFIVNAIRDLRGHETKHRSMLVNISRFIDVQNSICTQIDSYVRYFQREIKNYYAKGDEALKLDSFRYLKEIYEIDYADKAGFAWEEIQAALHSAVAPIVVRTVNGGNAAKNLNYDECEETGLRLIAIGGLSLSRGLTLEGLCVSYFHRNSKMYDTLMQMGRWFGYRPNYEDLCRVWMTETAIDWYEYISEASDELRNEVRRMRDAHKTPEEFGLSVRSDKDTLLVTALNKMRTAQNYQMTVSLNGKVIETPCLNLDKQNNQNNLTLTQKWLQELHDEGLAFADTKTLALNHPQILNVPKSKILEFLEAYHSHYLNIDFRTEDLIRVLSSFTDDTVDSWDIVIASGQSDQCFNVCGQSIPLVSRSFSFNEVANSIQLSGTKKRLGSRTFAKGGLKANLAKEIEAEALAAQAEAKQKRAFSDAMYFRSGKTRNPLLVIYPVELKTTSKNKQGDICSDAKKEKIKAQLPAVLIGLAIGIPSIAGKESLSYLYKINLVKYKELLGIDDDYEEIDETIVEE